MIEKLIQKSIPILSVPSITEDNFKTQTKSFGKSAYKKRRFSYSGNRSKRNGGRGGYQKKRGRN